MTVTVVSTTQKGAEGERIAATYLESHGWTVMDRNVRSRAGEIDLVITRDDVMAFVEVKSWASLPQEELAHSIDGRKRARISRAARAYLGRLPNEKTWRPRFDVVFVSGLDHRVLHIEDAFSGEGID
jgi:putative endonuclease